METTLQDVGVFLHLSEKKINNGMGSGMLSWFVGFIAPKVRAFLVGPLIVS